MVENIKPVEADQDGVEAALKALRNAEAMHEKLVAQEQKARARCEAAKSRAKGSRSKRLTNAVLLARQRREQLARQRGEVRAELREARKILREQQQLSRKAEHKERA